MPSILVAAVPEAAERLRRILAGRPVLVAATFDEASRILLRERLALAILGVYFAESRMFELVAEARGSEANRDTAIVCVLGVRRGLSEAFARSIERTVSTMRRCTFLDLSAIADDDAGNAAVRGFVEIALAGAASAAPVPAAASGRPPAASAQPD